MKISGCKAELCSKRGGCIQHNKTQKQLQPLDRFSSILYQNLQVNVILTLEFEIAALQGPCIQNNAFCVDLYRLVLLLDCRKLVLVPVAEA